MRGIAELMDMHGRVVLITGGAGHIGAAFAHALAELGASIVLLDIDKHRAEQLASELIVAYGVEAQILVCDLEDEESIKNAVNTLVQLDVLINNAALVGSSGLEGWAVPLADQSLSTWRRALEVNLTAAFCLIQGCLPLLNRSESPSIINVGSIYGSVGMDMRLYEGVEYVTPAAYAASKGGLTQLTRYLSTALAPKIRVNTISPGGIERIGQEQEFKERYEMKTPLSRMGSEEDLKGVVAFLASDLSSYVTGQNIMVDGGWSV